MNGLIVAIYIILMIIFLATSALIFRHTIKFSYLSPRFKTIIAVFAGIAVVVIIFSLFLVIRLVSSDSSSSSSSSNYTPSVNTSSSDINF